MTLHIRYRVWRSTADTSPESDTSGQYAGISEADAGADGITAYVSVDPDPANPGVPFNSLDLTGERADFQKLIDDLTNFIDINWPDDEPEPGEDPSLQGNEAIPYGERVGIFEDA